MTKQLRLFFTMLLLTLLGSSATWAGSVDISPSQALNGGTDPITVTCAKGDGTSDPAISSSQLRLYQAASGKTTGNTITFSSKNTITKIVFTFASGMTADNGEFSEGTYDSATSTWTGSTNSVTLTVTGTKSGERIYISAMTVNYEGGGTVISVGGDSWVETSLADLTEDDVFVIVGNNESTFALSNDKGTSVAPSAVKVTVSDGVLVETPAANIQWNLSGNATDGYTFYPNGSTSTWLYCTNTNNGVRVGTNDAKTFTIAGGYLKHVGTSRYVGIYNSQDWRCYTSINSNIEGQTFKFYKKPTTAPAVAKPTFDPADGEYTEAQSVTITCTTEGSTIYYTTDGTEPTNQSTPYTGAIAVSETTTIKAIAYVGTDASSVATATYTIVEPLSQITIAEARAQQTGEVLTAGIVTSVNGKTAYIQDNTAAIVVYGDNNLNVGDAITVQGTLTDYHGLLEISSNPTITVISQGNTVEPVVTAIADISNDNQGKLIKIEKATVTAIDDQNVTIAQGDNTIVVRFNSANDIPFAEGDVISLTGNIGYYNNVQIANPREIEIQGQKKFYLMGINDDWAKGIEFEYKGNGVYTLALTEELEANVTFKFKDSDGKWYFSESNGNYEINADNHSNIALQEANTMDNYYINIAGTWTFTITESENGTSLTVDGDWPRKRYYFIGQGKSDTSALEEMVFNEETGVYEYEYTPRAASDEAPAYWFAISDVASFTDWDDFNANHRYSAQEGDYTLTESNSKNVQLTKANGAMMFYNVGTYKLTLTEDLKLTVTGWPKELPEGNAFVKVTSTDDLTNGYYLIVYEGNDSHASVAFNGGLETLDAVNNTIDVTIGGDKIVATDVNKAAMFYIDNNAGTLQSESGFYIGKTAYSNGLDSSDETQYTNTFSIDEDGNAVITASGNCTLRYNYASDQIRFRYYKSGQQAIALYKLTTVEPVEVTLNKYGYATLYYGDMSLTVPEGVTATTYDEDVKESKTYAAGYVIPAGEAVVLKGDANAELSFELGEATAEPDANNALMGLDEAGTTVAPGDGDYKFYMLSAKSGKVGFYYGTGCTNGEAFQTAAHKAYLAVSVAAGAKECYIFGETTGINSIQNAEFAEGSVYNLNGQRVDKSYKGVVIVNGKKLIKK